MLAAAEGTVLRSAADAVSQICGAVALPCSRGTSGRLQDFTPEAYPARLVLSEQVGQHLTAEDERVEWNALVHSMEHGREIQLRGKLQGCEAVAPDSQL